MDAANIVEDAIAGYANRWATIKWCWAVRRGRLRRGGRAAGARIGDQLTCIFVDNGLLRKDEVRRGRGGVCASRVGNALAVNIETVDAAGRVSRRLEGVEDPEAKRKVIGATFIDVFEREAQRIEA